MPIFLLFVLVPIIEIALFIEIGGRIGLWTTLAIVFITAGVGSMAIRYQGRSLMRAFQTSSVLNMPELLGHGLLLFAAGVFLITPGFLTDICGLLLLLPPVRVWLRRQLMKRVTVTTFGGAAGQGPNVGPNVGPEPGHGHRPGTEPRPGPAPRQPSGARQGPNHSPASGPPRSDSPWRDRPSENRPSENLGDDVEDATVIRNDAPKSDRND